MGPKNSVTVWVYKPYCLRAPSGIGAYLLVRLIGAESNRDGVRADLRLTAATRTQIREVKAGSSYLGQNDARQHFGLGTVTRVDRLEVRWPSGRTEFLQNVQANHIITIREGSDIVGRVPFTR